MLHFRVIPLETSVQPTVVLFIFACLVLLVAVIYLLFKKLNNIKLPHFAKSAKIKTNKNTLIKKRKPAEYNFISIYRRSENGERKLLRQYRFTDEYLIEDNDIVIGRADENQNHGYRKFVIPTTEKPSRIHREYLTLHYSIATNRYSIYDGYMGHPSLHGFSENGIEKTSHSFTPGLSSTIKLVDGYEIDFLMQPNLTKRSFRTIESNQQAPAYSRDDVNTI